MVREENIYSGYNKNLLEKNLVGFFKISNVCWRSALSCKWWQLWGKVWWQIWIWWKGCPQVVEHGIVYKLRNRKCVLIRSCG